MDEKPKPKFNFSISSLLGEPCHSGSDKKSLIDQPSQENDFKKSFTDKSCQTELSWFGKNSTLYTFVDDGVKHSQYMGSVPKERPTVKKPCKKGRTNPQNANAKNAAKNPCLTRDALTNLIQNNRYCHSKDIIGNNHIHQAAMNGDLAYLNGQCILLKQLGSSVNLCNSARETALMLAVKKAVNTFDFRAVSILISEGADQSIADYESNTPLHCAVKHGCVQLVRILLSADNADKVTQKFNHEGLTPLHSAAKQGYDTIVELLLEKNIDINVKERKSGKTAYFLAVLEKKWTTAHLLRMRGANVNEPDFAGRKPPMPLILHPEEVTLSRQENVDDPGFLNTNLINQIGKGKRTSLILPPREERTVHVGRNEKGLRFPSQGHCEDKPKVFDNKELYNNHVEFASKRKSDFPIQDHDHQLRNALMKRSKLTPNVVLEATIDTKVVTTNVVVTSSISGQSQQFESGRYKKDSQNQSQLPLTPEGRSYNTICHNNMYCNARGINMNKHTVTYNKTGLNSYNNTANCKAQEMNMNNYTVTHNNTGLNSYNNTAHCNSQEMNMNNYTVTNNNTGLNSYNNIAQDYHLQTNNTGQNEQKCYLPRILRKRNKFVKSPHGTMEYNDKTFISDKKAGVTDVASNRNKPGVINMNFSGISNMGKSRPTGPQLKITSITDVEEKLFANLNTTKFIHDNGISTQQNPSK